MSDEAESFVDCVVNVFLHGEVLADSDRSTCLELSTTSNAGLEKSSCPIRPKSFEKMTHPIPAVLTIHFKKSIAIHLVLNRAMMRLSDRPPLHVLVQ